MGDFEFIIKTAVESAVDATASGGKLTAPPQAYEMLLQRGPTRPSLWCRLSSCWGRPKIGEANRDAEGAQVQLVSRNGLTIVR